VLTMKLQALALVKDKLKEITDKVGLTADLDSLVSNLSPGSKRKLSIGLALIGDPELLILDEPTANLDLNSREKIWNILIHLVRRPGSRMSVLVSTQHIEESETLSTRVFIIKDGKKILCEPVSSRKAQTGLKMTFIQNHDNNFINNNDSSL
jgi:ABC-type multidrug transport system ATPase subunit